MAAHMKALIGVLIALLIFLGAYVALKKPAAVAEGPAIDAIEKMRSEGVPIFKVKDLEGADVDLESLKGKVVILNFWASWCEPCVEEVPSLISLIQKLKGQVILLAISGDSDLKEIHSFMKSFPELKAANISIVWDKDKSLVEKYKVDRLPETFILGKDLKLVKKVAGSVRWDHPESVKYFEQLAQAQP